MANKPDPNKSNVSQFPGGEKSEEFHIAKADELRPDTLNEKEVAVWNKIAPELSKVGRLKRLYIEIISEYCRIVVRLFDARKDLDERDWTYVTTGRHGSQEKSRPEVAQVNDDWRKLRSIISDLGLSPSAERNLSQQGELFPGDFSNF